MKRIIVMLISVILLGTLGAHAQSANRKGFFVDIMAGDTFGYVYKSDKTDDNGKPLSYMKGGFVLGADFGMRFPTSLHWAFQFKLGTDINMSLPKAADIHLKLGMRWTSNDFAGNKSAFIGLYTGFGFVPGAKEGYNIPVDINAGINLTNKIALSLFMTNNFYWGDWKTYYHSGSGRVYEELQTHVVAGIRFSYRF